MLVIFYVSVWILVCFLLYCHLLNHEISLFLSMFTLPLCWLSLYPHSVYSRSNPYMCEEIYSKPRIHQITFIHIKCRGYLAPSQLISSSLISFITFILLSNIKCLLVFYVFTLFVLMMILLMKDDWLVVCKFYHYYYYYRSSSKFVWST